MVELFMPTEERNRQTEQFCRDLSVAIAIKLLAEMEDPKKATHCYLSMAEGEHSQAVISQQEELASYGMQANNDPSEGMFATFTDKLCNGGRINLASAAGIGQARYNHDYYCGHEDLVGKGSNIKTTTPHHQNWGPFIHYVRSCRIHCLLAAKKHCLLLGSDLLKQSSVNILLVH
jgi:hypothetical protein